MTSHGDLLHANIHKKQPLLQSIGVKNVKHFKTNRLQDLLNKKAIKKKKTLKKKKKKT